MKYNLPTNDVLKYKYSAKVNIKSLMLFCRQKYVNLSV